MLETQKYLINNSIEKLEEEFCIYSRRHNKYENLVLFKYNMIDSPMDEIISQECRGLILDEDNDWKVVSMSFKKFFNYGESLAAKIDWSTARIYEKLDGSLCVLYYYDGNWRVQTSGSPDASGNVHYFGMTFEELFWETFEENGYSLPEEKDLCYSFELTSQYNRIVVEYKRPRLTLIGVRDKNTLEERKIQSFGEDFKVVKTYNIKQELDEIISFLDDKPGKEMEGFVVCDQYFNRIKIKSADYIRWHYFRDRLNYKSIVDLIRQGEYEEVVEFYSEYKDIFDEVQEKYKKLLKELNFEYKHIKDIENQKEFALQALRTTLPSALFEVRKGRFDCISEYLKQMNIKNLCQVLGLDRQKSLREDN